MCTCGYSMYTVDPRISEPVGTDSCSDILNMQNEQVMDGVTCSIQQFSIVLIQSLTVSYVSPIASV